MGLLGNDVHRQDVLLMSESRGVRSTMLVFGCVEAQIERACWFQTDLRFENQKLCLIRKMDDSDDEFGPRLIVLRMVLNTKIDTSAWRRLFQTLVNGQLSEDIFSLLFCSVGESILTCAQSREVSKNEKEWRKTEKGGMDRKPKAN